MACVHSTLKVVCIGWILSDGGGRNTEYHAQNVLFSPMACAWKYNCTYPYLNDVTRVGICRVRDAMLWTGGGRAIRDIGVVLIKREVLGHRDKKQKIRQVFSVHAGGKLQGEGWTHNFKLNTYGDA